MAISRFSVTVSFLVLLFVFIEIVSGICNPRRIFHSSRRSRTDTSYVNCRMTSDASSPTQLSVIATKILSLFEATPEAFPNFRERPGYAPILSLCNPNLSQFDPKPVMPSTRTCHNLTYRYAFSLGCSSWEASGFSGTVQGYSALPKIKW